VLKDLEAFIYSRLAGRRRADSRTRRRRLHQCQPNLILIGGTVRERPTWRSRNRRRGHPARARGPLPSNLVDLVNQPEQEKAAGKDGRIVGPCCRHDLIVIDELGYLPFSQSGAQLLSISSASSTNNTSIVTTTNPAPSPDWPQIFGDGQNDHRQARSTDPSLRDHRTANESWRFQKPRLSQPKNVPSERQKPPRLRKTRPAPPGWFPPACARHPTGLTFNAEIGNTFQSDLTR